MAEFDIIIRNLWLVVITPLIFLIVSGAVVVFVWGAAQFILNADNPDGRQKGRNHMIWSFVGFFIIFSAVVIIRVVLATFGIDDLPFPLGTGGRPSGGSSVDDLLGA